MSLNDTRIRNAKRKAKPYKLTDEKGLYVLVTPAGAKLWRYRYRIDGKENVHAMGEYGSAPDFETAEHAQARRDAGHFTLEEARQERIRARRLVKQGIHPKNARDTRKALEQAESANTFAAVGREWFERRRKHWSDTYAATINGALERHVYPKIGALPIRSVKTSHVREILDSTKDVAITAINIRQWCSLIFGHGMMTERVDGDPSAPLKGYIKKRDTKHRTPLTKDGISALVKRMDASTEIVTPIALKLLLLIFVRPSELRRAEWTEFDLNRAVWTIPAEKMKKKHVHIVPLCAQAVQLLKRLQSVTGNRRYLFPNQRRLDDCMSENVLNRALQRLGYEGQFTAHGFRATASTELHEMGFRTDIIEFQLAHVERNQTKASYNQAQFMAERRKMMQQWADMIDAWVRGDKVVAGHFGRAA